MNAVTRIPAQQQEMVTAQQAEDMRLALKSSLYPGATDGAIDLVLAYCRAGGYDPMMKPVHIVPMKVATGRKDERGYDVKEMRDVVMPGIGLYRTNASRTGLYAGCSEPEFGPTRQLHYKRERWKDGPNNRRVKEYVDDVLEYPEWCRVTVSKIVAGEIRQFTASERWLENYAEKGDDGEPNSMWMKRPFAQLAKCTEAQALRKAFPEQVGSQPTAEEMEGKSLVIEGEVGGTPVHVAMPAERQLPQAAEAQGGAAKAPAAEKAEKQQQSESITSLHSDQGPGIFDLSESQLRILKARAKAAGLMHAEGLDAALVEKFDRIDPSNLNAVLNALRAAE